MKPNPDYQGIAPNDKYQSLEDEHRKWVAAYSLMFSIDDAERNTLQKASDKIMELKIDMARVQFHVS